MATTAHKAPNYVLIWAYLFGSRCSRSCFAFEMPISRNLKILVLLGIRRVRAQPRERCFMRD